MIYEFLFLIPLFHLILPVGISFYTFQTLSYVIDVYRGTIKPEYHFGYYALFVSFWNSYLWPLLVARSKDIRTVQITLATLPTVNITDTATGSNP